MKTILIMEAVAQQRECLTHWLRDDYTVVTAADGAAGVALAERTEPDLILLAQRLPDMDGPEAVRRLQTRSRLQDIPIIALPVPDAEPTAIPSAGYAEALRAPLTMERLETTLRRWLGGG
ncbi:MAG: response regulator [Candidatus Tectomicrobia bacterium]|uniref:Response regulator n=1 Tax=Tectimicrobiota bacterium TaxID=2528274 RepID=A0A937W3X5_UNCTE|nr:response regulator [Candidatus Tectomicrobia bacterium]